MCRFVTTLALGTLIALAVACGSDKQSVPPADSGAADTEAPAADQATAEPDAAAPSAGFADLPPYEGFQGSVDLAVTASPSVDKVELLADGKVVATATAAPFKITWDTTAGSDGMVALSLKAHAGTATATGEPVSVVVYNNGETVKWTEATDPQDPVMAGEMSIQPNVDTDVKYHWTMPKDIKRVIGVLHWDNPAFEMSLAVGIGFCPHSGHAAKEVPGKTSPIAVDFVPPPDGLIPEGQWFSHVRADNAADLAGQKSKVSFKTYILR